MATDHGYQGTLLQDKILKCKLPSLLFQVLCESRFGDTAGAAWEYQMVATFLVSTGMGDIREALDWIHENTGDE